MSTSTLSPTKQDVLSFMFTAPRPSQATTALSEALRWLRHWNPARVTNNYASLFGGETALALPLTGRLFLGADVLTIRPGSAAFVDTNAARKAYDKGSSKSVVENLTDQIKAQELTLSPGTSLLVLGILQIETSVYVHALTVGQNGTHQDVWLAASQTANVRTEDGTALTYTIQQRLRTLQDQLRQPNGTVKSRY